MGGLHEGMHFVPPERERNFPNLRFEPGLHGPNRSLDEVIKRVYKGKHTWNDAVAQRMSSYNPEVVALDGQDPSYFDYILNANVTLTLAKKLWIWHGLPAEPSLIRSDGKLDLIRGDLEFARLIDLPLDPQNPEYQYQQRQLNRVMDDMSLLNDKYEDQYTETGDTEIKIRAGLGVGLFGGFWYLTRKKGEERVDQTGVKNRFSRRTLLRGVAALGLMSPSALLISSEYGAARAESEELADVFQDITTILRLRFAEGAWVDGRTALVIAKTQDAFTVLNKPSDTRAAVIMGTAHAGEGEILLKSASARNKIIKDFVGELVNSVDEIVASYPFIPRDAARQRLLDNIAKADIVSITDPGVRPGEPDFLGYLDNSIQLTHTFQSPQVEEAIAEFR